jgi:hypothetical protein
MSSPATQPRPEDAEASTIHRLFGSPANVTAAGLLLVSLVRNGFLAPQQ